MTVGYEEFRSLTVEAIEAVLAKLRARVVSAGQALAEIDQLVQESNLAYDDGDRIGDDELRARLARHYGDQRPLSWERTEPWPDEAKEMRESCGVHPAGARRWEE